MRNPLLMTFSLLFAMHFSLAASQQLENSAFEARRAEFRANMIKICSASIIDRGIQEAVRKAATAGTVGLTEEAIRKTASSDKVRGVVAGVCGCIEAKPLTRLDQARTDVELSTIIDQFRTPEPVLAMINADSMKRCAGPLQAPALIAPRQRPATQDWQQIGTFEGTHTYVDARSIKRRDGGKVEAWVRVVFAAPKATSDGTPYVSVELFQNFDCGEQTVQTISTAAFSDEEGQKVVLRFELGEIEARFTPVGTGNRQRPMYDRVCAEIVRP